MANRAIVFIAIMVLLVAGSVGLVSQDQQAVRTTGDETHTNESWNVQPGSWTTLQHSNQPYSYSLQENVTVTQDGQQYIADGNWTWNHDNGSIKAIQGTNLNDSKSAYVEYSYFEPTESQSTVRALSTIFIGLGPEAITLAGIIVLMGAVGILTRLGGI